MKVRLFDTIEMPPRSKSGQIIVYTGFNAEDDTETVTYIDCVYEISDHLVEFRKNSDLHSARFEDALKWAVSYADAIGIQEVYAMFTLGRPLDIAAIRRICPEGFVDCRRNTEAPEAASSPDRTPCRTYTTPGWVSSLPGVGSKIRRTIMVDNRVNVVGDA